MRAHLILFVAICSTLAACDDSDAPLTDGPSTVGTLVVSTSSGGNDPDQDGYLLTVDGIDSLPLHPAGAFRIDLPVGQHTLRLLGMGEACSVSPGAGLDVVVSSGDTTSVAFEVTCLMTGVRVTIGVTGLDFDTDGYRLEVDGIERGILPSIGTVVTRLDPGSRTIAVTGLAPNCTIDGLRSQTVTIVVTEITPVEFMVVCTAVSGVIKVVVEASGTDVDGEYEALVDGASPFTVLQSRPGYRGAVAAGEHVISLLAPANCSVETPPRAVIVTGGALVRDTVEVTFSVMCERSMGTLRITVPMTGPPQRIVVWICPTRLEHLCHFRELPNAPLVLRTNVPKMLHLGAFAWNLEIKDIPTNCRVDAPNPRRGVTLTHGDTVSVTFPIICES